MKKLFSLLVLLFIGVATMLCSCKGKTEISIVKFGTHTSLDEIESSIKEKLHDVENVVSYNANFSPDNASQIMTSLKSKSKIVVAIATPVAQAAYNKLSSDTKIVFAAVSDPIGAGLVTDINHPTENITGTSDEIQINLLIDKALEINPSLKKIGFIYNPSEDNSVTNKNKIIQYATSKNLTVECQGITSAGEMKEVASVLCSKVDAMLVTDDNTVASSMEALSQECIKNKIPCYTGADSLVRDGGMLCVGINYKTLGQYTGQMVLDILDGKSISDMPVKVFNENLKTYVNFEYISKINLTLPVSITSDPNLVEINNDN